MIDVNALRKGVTFELDNQLYMVLEYTHTKPGRGNATIRTKVRNLRTGSTLEKTFQSGDRVQDIRLDHHTVQFLYTDGQFYHFMDTETYEQPALSQEQVGESSNFLREGLEMKLTYYENEPIDLEIPASVDLKIVECEVGVRGDTATGASKLATLESGFKVQVPLFVNTGDTIRVNTTTGAYVTRA